MKISDQQPDTLLLLLVKLSLFYLLCLFMFHGMFAKAKTMQTGIASGSVSSVQHKIRQIYTAEIGIREIPVNAGKRVEEYLRYVNLPKGNPWCAAFICWVLGQAGVENPRTGWSPGLFGSGRVIWRRNEPRTKSQASRLPPDLTFWEQRIKSKEQGFPPGVPFGGQRVRSKDQGPRTADIFGLYFPEKGRIAHVGFIDTWDGTWLVTVEGNTNVSGSREGDGVYRKRRLVKSVYEVARYGE